MKQLVFDIAPPPQPTLENFVIGPNAEILAQVHALLAGQSHERFVYLWGGTGCGKSHLLQSMAGVAAAQPWRVCQAHAAAMCSEEVATTCDLVLVEDVLTLDADGQNRLFNIMNWIWIKFARKSPQKKPPSPPRLKPLVGAIAPTPRAPAAGSPAA